MSVRRRLFDIIQPDQGDSRGSRLFDWTITALILVCVAIAFVVTFDPPRELVNALLVVEQIASVARLGTRKDREQDAELDRQQAKDDEHDRLLREHGELLREISDKLSKLSSR